LTFDLLGIGFRGFFIGHASNLMTQVTSFEELIQLGILFFFYIFFLCFYHTSFFKKDWFCGYPNFVFVLVYSDLMTYAMSFASLFLIEVFFKCFVLYLIFEEFLFIFV
jgi:hypothetical protein